MKQSRIILAYGVLGALILALLLIQLCFGSVAIPFPDVFRILFGQGGDAAAADILLQIRLPRALAAMILGGALALSGYLLQTFFHNPIAGPFILGISSGAKLAVALMMMVSLSLAFQMSSVLLISAAFVGAMAAMGLVLLLSKVLHRMSMLIVAGVMIGYICSAITDFVVNFADDANIVNLHNWTKGSFSGISWENVLVMSIVVFAVLIGVFLLAKPISAYQLGEEYARSMGLNVKAFRVALVLLSSILAACVTAFAGPVSFVGIAVPHLIKALFRTAKPLVLIPACFLGGSVFCLFCDFLSRIVFAPTELSISTVTAVFGAPVVIWILIRRRKERAS